MSSEWPRAAEARLPFQLSGVVAAKRPPLRQSTAVERHWLMRASAVAAKSGRLQVPATGAGAGAGTAAREPEQEPEQERAGAGRSRARPAAQRFGVPLRHRLGGRHRGRRAHGVGDGEVADVGRCAVGAATACGHEGREGCGAEERADAVVSGQGGRCSCSNHSARFGALARLTRTVP